MSRSLALASLLACAGLALPTAASGKVWVVGPAGVPGVDFATLQEAVDAATDGDLVLVRPGASPGYTFHCFKDVAIVGDGGGAPVSIQGRLTLCNWNPSYRILVRGLEFSSGSQAALEIGSGAGALLGVVWLEDCSFLGWDPSDCCGYGVFSDPLFPPDPNGLLAATRVRFAGAGSNPGGGISGPHAALWDSVCEGGDGQTIPSGQGLEGGDGLEFLTSRLFASGTRFVGGDGAPGTCASSGAGGGNGGSALRIESLEVGIVDCVLQPGAAGGAPAPCAPGQPGLLVKPPTTPFVTYPGTAHSLALSAPVREGQVLTGSLRGEAGELALVAWSSGTANVPLASLVGVLVLAPPQQIAAIGTVPPSGTLPIAATIQELGAGVEFALIFFQSAFCSPISASCVLGSPSAAVLLDAAF